MLRRPWLEGVEQVGGDLLGALAQPLDGPHGEDPGDELAVAGVVGRLGHQQRRRLHRVERGRRGPPGDPAEHALVGRQAGAEVVARQQVAYGGVAGRDVPDAGAVERAARPDLLDQVEDLVLGAQRPDPDQLRLQVAARGGPPQEQRGQSVGHAPVDRRLHVATLAAPRVCHMSDRRWLVLDLVLVGVFAVDRPAQPLRHPHRRRLVDDRLAVPGGHAGSPGPRSSSYAVRPRRSPRAWSSGSARSSSGCCCARRAGRARPRRSWSSPPSSSARCWCCLESVHVSDADDRPRGAALPSPSSSPRSSSSRSTSVRAPRRRGRSSRRCATASG